MVTVPKDQGTCGSCWAFTTVGLYESWLLIAGMEEYDLSEEYILECTTQDSPAGYPSTCAGGYVDYSIPFAVEGGLPLDTDFPYQAGAFGGTNSTPTTVNICTTTSKIIETEMNGTYSSYRDITDEYMKELVSYAPVAVLMYAPIELSSYTSGVWPNCPNNHTAAKSMINHAVLVVGYDEDGNWIIKNSWGTGWGEDGFAVISKEDNCAMLAYVYEIRGANEPLLSENLRPMFMALGLLVALMLYL